MCLFDGLVGVARESLHKPFTAMTTAYERSIQLLSFDSPINVIFLSKSCRCPLSHRESTIVECTSFKCVYLNARC